MYTFKAFGADSSIWNLRPSTSGTTLKDFIFTSASDSRLEFSVPKFSATGFSTGTFIVNGTQESGLNITGKMLTNTFSISGSVVQRESWSQGFDVQQLFNFEYQLSTLNGDDIFEGSSLNKNDGDGIQGLAGNDRFKGYDDDQFGDSFYGGDGRDTSIYQGKISDYTIRVDTQIWDNRVGDGTRTSGFRIDDTVLNRDGTDYLIQVERLEFEQASANGVNRLALDTGKDQTAGSGYMLYKAAFNRTPDVGGLGFWINQMDTGMSYSDVAKNFVNSAEFKTAFGGSNPTVNTLVTKLYNNVLNRAPDAGGLAFWQEKLTTGWSTADVLGYFSTSAENVTNVTPLIANGIQYQQFVG